MSDLFGIVRGAWRGRLLARSAEEYRRLTGASWETIADHRDDGEEMRRYYRLLNRECVRLTDEALDEMVTSYERMSRVWRGDGFDWMERRHPGLRRKFCRRLFRLATSDVCRVTVEEDEAFRLKDCDGVLMDTLFPGGMAKGEGRRDLIFLLLIAFGVIAPMPSSRGRDGSVEELRKQLEAMIALVETLRDDYPGVGVLPKPVIFDIVAGDLQGKLERLDEPEEVAECTVGWFWLVLSSVMDGSISASSPQHVSDVGVGLAGYRMNGIWVDDADEGRTRFWVFPDNKLMAFCYHRVGAAWHLLPYEFGFYTRGGEDELDALCTFCTVKGNREMMAGRGGEMSRSEIVTATYETAGEEEWWPFGEISFECKNHREAPEWFDWRSFRCLGREDARHGELRGVLEEVYRTGSALGMLFVNEGAFMTDSEDALLGIDREYVYVTAATRQRPGRMVCTDEEDEVWEYQAVEGEDAVTLNMMNVEVSAECPLYLLPRFLRKTRGMTAAQRRFAEAVANTVMEDQVTIYRVGDRPEGVLCLNRFSLVVPLDEEGLREYGIRTLTARKA